MMWSDTCCKFSAAGQQLVFADAPRGSWTSAELRACLVWTCVCLACDTAPLPTFASPDLLACPVCSCECSEVSEGT